jgi:hypothetical protein
MRAACNFVINRSLTNQLMRAIKKMMGSNFLSISMRAAVVRAQSQLAFDE